MMNKIVLIALIALLFSCVEKKPKINNESKKVESNNSTEKSEKLTKIEFDTEMHDFGLVKSGEILAYSFVFTNRGETDFIINKTESDCGCIEATFSGIPTLPDEKGFVEIKFNSAGMFGKQLKTVEIQSNSKEPKHLIIFAEVENEQIELLN